MRGSTVEFTSCHLSTFRPRDFLLPLGEERVSYIQIGVLFLLLPLKTWAQILACLSLSFSFWKMGIKETIAVYAMLP